MKKIYTNDLMPGMVLATDVYNYNDQLILPAGSELTDKSITKLTFYAIPFVRIKDDVNAAPVEQPVQPAVESTPEISYAERIKESAEFKAYKQEFEHTVEKMKGAINDIVEKNAPLMSVNYIIDDSLNMLQMDGAQTHVFDMIHNMRQYDDQTFAHSLNVGLICHVFAKWLKMTDEQAQLALTCGILHDIGKILIPENIIKKPGKLTAEEFSLIKTHPIEGFNVLKNHNVNEHVKNAALMHHERYDGSGYPLGMKGDQIDKYARIVAIADVYEATTAPRKYRGPLCPFTVISIFESEGLQKYDTKMIMTFLENIVNTYMLNRVRLSDGQEGEIVFINKQVLSKPMVKCGGTYIDLSKEKDLSITEII